MTNTLQSYYIYIRKHFIILTSCILYNLLSRYCTLIYLHFVPAAIDVSTVEIFTFPRFDSFPYNIILLNYIINDERKYCTYISFEGLKVIKKKFLCNLYYFNDLLPLLYGMKYHTI